MLKGVVSSDHVYMYIEYPLKLNISIIVKQMKGHTSRKIQQEFPELKNDIGVIIFFGQVMELEVLVILLIKWLMNT